MLTSVIVQKVNTLRERETCVDLHNQSKEKRFLSLSPSVMLLLGLLLLLFDQHPIFCFRVDTNTLSEETPMMPFPFASLAKETRSIVS